MRGDSRIALSAEGGKSNPDHLPNFPISSSFPHIPIPVEKRHGFVFGRSSLGGGVVRTMGGDKPVSYTHLRGISKTSKARYAST